MKDIFRPFKRKIVCDIYGCRNTSEFEIGHPTVRANSLHLCRECASDIFTDMVPEFDSDLKKQREEAVQEAKEQVAKAAEPEQQYYTCRFCGEQFKKPEELGKYKGHVINCKRRV